MATEIIEEYAAWAHAERRATSRTLKSYQGELLRLARFFPQEPITSLTEAQLKRYLFERHKEAPGSPSNKYAALRGFYGYLVRTGQRPDNPTTSLRPPRHYSRPPKVLPSLGQLSQRLQRLDPKALLVAKFLREVGSTMNLDEVESISVEPPVGREVKVEDGRGRTRLVTLNDRAMEYLNSLGGRLPAKRTIQRYLQKVGISPRDLRSEPRSSVGVDLHPTLERSLHTQIGSRLWETAARDAFNEVEQRLRHLVGSATLYGRRAADVAFAKDGPFAAVLSERERESLRLLFTGAFGYFRNELGHRPVRYADDMLAREVLLLGDLLMRVLDGIEADLITRHVDQAPATVKDRSLEELKLMEPIEFQRWAVEQFRGSVSPRHARDMGIDGLSFHHGRPIQVRRSESVGRITVDNFETAVERAGKRDGYLVAFSFTRDAYEEAERARNARGVDIRLVTVEELLKERGASRL